jgi:hypothetical protein
MNKLLPILLVIVLGGCASQPKSYSVEYTSNAKEILGECENLNCKLADELCGTKDDKGFRNVAEDECRMKIARYNRTKPLNYPDPCLTKFNDCSINSELASEICFDWNNNTKLNEAQCKNRIENYRLRIIKGQSHDEAKYGPKPAKISTPSKLDKMLSDIEHDRVREITKKREAATREIINNCVAGLKRGIYKDKPESWLRDKCNPY